MDFHAWAFEQARRLRAGEPLDVENVAEELETLGRSERQQLTNRLAILLAHMLKWEFQSSKRTPSWLGTINEQRLRVNRLLAEMPSLQPRLTDCIADAYAFGRLAASTDTGIVEEEFPNSCPYTEAEILGGA